MATIKGTYSYDGLQGTNGSDIIFGYGARDVIKGNGGNDVLKGGGGADKLFGGTGIDTADYSDSNVGVQVSLKLGGGSYGTAHGDRLYEIENVSGSNHDDILEGDENANVLYGEAGNDVLKGGGGADTLRGGGGSDQLNSDGDDNLDGGAGVDTAYFQGSAGVRVDLEQGTVERASVDPWSLQYSEIVGVEHVKGTNLGDTIAGNAGNNNLYGYLGDDELIGGDGNDALNGGEGHDLLRGGAGNDSLIGGPGDDFFVFAGVGLGDTGKDSVKGFSAGDHVVLDKDVFDSFADVKANMKEVGGHTVITIDADTTITMVNVKMSSLSASDFLFW